ncbi:MAG: endoribonuclease YbeY [Candidatus Tectimicrobiota bacterium]|nr:MAG: endoribonuclease YbeY [Candidatus Tectomicrobia bacterium]
MALSVQNRQRVLAISTAALKRRLQRALHYLRCADCEVNVVLVGERAMRRLNRAYRHRDAPTNVLAFPQEGEPPAGPRVLGDVVVSLPTAAREAQAAGQSLLDYVTYLAIHGLLHLLGYDHERSPQEHRRMRRRERAVLAYVLADGGTRGG